ncbi:MAG: NADH-quinone oxidoreductase subunit B family protein [Promethearchaeota archaeon]
MFKKKLVVKALTNSPWVMHVNSGSCNGCDIEVLATFIPRYDVERFGIMLHGTPRHCDVLVATGTATFQTVPRLKRLYEQMPEPKYVVAVGVCATTGGVFQESYNTLGGVDKVIPVSAYVTGCPPRPEAIVDGIIKLIQRIRLDTETSDKATEEVNQQ